jgi:hypothetical protein
MELGRTARTGQKRPFAVTITRTVQKLVDINFEHLYGLVTLFGHPTRP